VTAGQVAEIIRRAQSEGVSVTAETCPHYLLLSNEHFSCAGNLLKTYPPVRYKQDQLALWQALKDGVIGHICSDHAPHTPQEKAMEFSRAPAGICGVETMVALIADCVGRGLLSMNQLAQWLSENPARHYGLYPQKGTLKVGSTADITVMDFSRSMTISADNLHSVSKTTPYEGFVVKGIPVATFLHGKLIAQDGEPVSDVFGGSYLVCK